MEDEKVPIAKSKREDFIARMTSRYPDLDVNDEEALYGRVNDDYDDYSAIKDRESKFSEWFVSDPRAARLMTGWREGGDPAVELVRLYGDDFLEARNDPEKLEAFAQANEEYKQRVADEKKYAEDFKANLKKSLEEAEALKESEGLTDDEIDEAMQFVIEMSRDSVLGIFKPEVLKLALKARNYDMDVERASREGEVLGRNAKIEEKLRKPRMGDGVAQLENGGGTGKKSRMPDLGAIGRFGDENVSIFERGGEKRKRARN